MILRKLIPMGILVVLCFGRQVSSQVNGLQVAAGATAQVFGGKAPVVKVTDAEGNELAAIPIEKDPSYFAYSKSANTVYVVHNEKKGEHFISAVNLTTNHVDKQIAVGAGEVVELLVSDDGRRVFAYTAAKVLVNGGTYFYLDGVPFYNRNRCLLPPYEPKITVIDTSSNEVVATYDWFDSFPASQEKNPIFANQLLAADKQGRLIIWSKVMGSKEIDEKLTVFLGSSSKPVAMADTRGYVAAAMFSQDEKLLFAAIKGDKKTDGSLAVLDVEKGTIVNHPLTGHPTRLFRLGSNQEPWILGSEEMQALSETGEPTGRRIPLNRPVRSGENGEASASALLEGLPGETLSLGNDYAAIQINNKHGGSEHKVALVNLKKLQVDAIIPTMSSGEIAGIRTGRFVAAFGLSMATGGTIIFTPNFIRNESLAARPDGRFLFALDVEGHVITVVDVHTATVERRIPVNGSVTKLQVSSDGKHLICYGKRVQQINLETNNLEN